VGQEPEEVVPAAEAVETATPAEAESLEPVASVAVAAEDVPDGEGAPTTERQPSAEPGEDESPAS